MTLLFGRADLRIDNKVCDPESKMGVVVCMIETLRATEHVPEASWQMYAQTCKQNLSGGPLTLVPAACPGWSMMPKWILFQGSLTAPTPPP